jgi:lipopolysaccharide export system permease protein
MSRLLFLYMSKRIAITAVLIEVSLCVPVVVTSLFHHLPPAAVSSGLMVPALLGTLPTALYLALPMSIGVAVAMELARMSSDGMIAVLYSLRLSPRWIAAPAAFVGAIGVAIGLWLSSVFAPAHVGGMHDVIHVIRNSLDHRMLEPARFYTFDKGKWTLYFERWLSPDVVAGIFIYRVFADKNEEQVVGAAKAEFRRGEHNVLLVLIDGSIVTRPLGGTALESVNFVEHAMPIDLQGSAELPQRGWRGVFELPLGEFFASMPVQEYDPRRYSEWMSEAAKRCGIPLLALVHALMAMGLVLGFGSATGRRSRTASALVLVTPAIHVAILLLAETLVRQDPRMIWLVAVAIAVELVVALALIERRHGLLAPGATGFGRPVQPGPAAAG